MTANDTRSYPGYLNKLVDKYSDIYHHSIGIKILMLTILFWLKKLNRVKKLSHNNHKNKFSVLDEGDTFGINVRLGVQGKSLVLILVKQRKKFAL